MNTVETQIIVKAINSVRYASHQPSKSRAGNSRNQNRQSMKG